MNPNWLAKYKPISDRLMVYGWFVAPFLIGAEFTIVEEADAYVTQHPPKSDQDRRDIEERIYHALCEPVFNSGYRARATWYGKQIPHFREFNHLYESAIFSYYKREYAQAVLCLLSALEGILLSFYGFNIKGSQQRPSLPDLLKCIKTATLPYNVRDFEVAHDMYRDTLVTFLENWIYKNTKTSDFSLSVLNRHYVLHGLEAGNFYRPQDLHRLILAFDLIIEFLALRGRILHVLLPDRGRDAFLDRRRGYYGALAKGTPSVAQSWKIERAFLSEHVNYVSPPHDPNVAESVAKAVTLVLALVDKVDRKPPSEG